MSQMLQQSQGSVRLEYQKVSIWWPHLSQILGSAVNPQGFVYMYLKKPMFDVIWILQTRGCGYAVPPSFSPVCTTTTTSVPAVADKMGLARRPAFLALR